MPWRRGLQLAWQAIVVSGLALLCLLVLAWLTLQWGILPHIEDWRPAIERHASRAVGVPVRIGHIAVRSSGWVPALELRDVVLRDSSGAEAVRLPRVSAALSPRSLLLLTPRLSQLYIEGARLLVRRDAQGRVHVGGLDVGASSGVASGDEAATLDWFFRQEELVLRHGTLRWVDDQRQAPALELTAVDIVVRNGLRSHDLRIDATPPTDWGDRASLRGRFEQPLFARAGDWRRWDGTLYAELPRGDVAQLKRHVDLPFELDGGQGALRLWLDVQDAGWRAATADVQLRDVKLRLAHDIEPLAIARAAGRLSAQRSAAGVTLAAERFGFETASGVAWPEGALRLAWQQHQGSIDDGLVPGKVLARHAGSPASAASSPTDADADADARRLPWDTGAPVTSGELSADQLDLALMRKLAGALPLPAGARRWLADIQPEGVVQGLAARWDGPVDAPLHYRANAAISGLGIAAGAAPASGVAGRPGWRNATLNFDASETGGVAHVSMDGGAVELPGVFEEPVIPFDRFGATVNWSIGPVSDATRKPALAVTLRDVHFANADADGDLQLQWHAGAGVAVPAGASAASSAGAIGRGQRLPGLIDLQGELVHARAAKLSRYLPLHVPQSTRRYLRDAFTAGEMSAVKFTVRGDLAGFPYQRLHDGEFRIAGRVSDVALNYVPGAPAEDGTPTPSAWPAFTKVAGEIVLDRGALEIHDAQARMGELVLQGVNGGIASLYDKPGLALRGAVAGPMPEFLRYVAQSPIGGWLHGGLANATSTGDAELAIALEIPLHSAGATVVNGTLALANNDVRLVPAAPLLGAARARIDFTEHGVTVGNGAARVLGGDVTFDGGTQPDGALRFNAQGSIGADGLHRVADEPTLARLVQHVSGQTSYRLQIAIAKGQTEFALTSPLVGVALSLPPPLNKPADATWPLRVATTVSFDPQGRPRDTLHVDLGHPQAPLLQAEVLRDLSGPVPRPLRAVYAVGTTLPAPQAGGVAALGGASFNGDAWWSFWRGLSAAPVAAGAAPLPSPAAPDATTASGAAAYWPLSTTLRTGDLLLGGRHLTHVDLQLARVQAPGGDTWRANIASDQTHGVVEYRPDSAARAAELFVRLDRLSLEADADGGKATPTDAEATANPVETIPALDIVVDNFELNAKKLGKLEVAATLQSGARDWRLTRLALSTPEATFTGSGEWSGAPARRMALDFKLDLADSGALLERLAMGRVLKGGKGALSGAVTWTGSPLALDYPSLQGRLKVALDAGQFLKADAGAARLLGVLSLQSLPRRLTLDFRDLFQEGFAFDNVTGDVLIDKGVASTNDLRMRGVSAAVLMEGSADLKAETQDLRVIVVPEVNAGAASLAYAAINPIIGIGTFLAQLFLRNPLAEAGTKEFHVVGSWADPKVEQVEHKVAVEAAEQARAAQAAAAASAASAP